MERFDLLGNPPSCSLGQTRPEAKAPGEQFLPPTPASAANGAVVFEYSREAGPDQTFFMVGERFTGDVIAWGPSASKPGGQEWKPRVQLLTRGQTCRQHFPSRRPTACSWSGPGIPPAFHNLSF